MMNTTWQLPAGLFHQMMDGLNALEGIPLIALLVKAASEQRNAACDNHCTVTLLLEFHCEDLATVLSAKEGLHRVNASSWGDGGFCAQQNKA